jgi:hypothetical protein
VAAKTSAMPRRSDVGVIPVKVRPFRSDALRVTTHANHLRLQSGLIVVITTMEAAKDGCTQESKESTEPPPKTDDNPPDPSEDDLDDLDGMERFPPDVWYYTTDIFRHAR